jgi:hypothetical protein
MRADTARAAAREIPSEKPAISGFAAVRED